MRSDRQIVNDEIKELSIDKEDNGKYSWCYRCDCSEYYVDAEEGFDTLLDTLIHFIKTQTTLLDSLLIEEDDVEIPESTSAVEWTSKFAEFLSTHPQPSEAALFTWFANAIMAGYDLANRQKRNSKVLENE